MSINFSMHGACVSIIWQAMSLKSWVIVVALNIHWTKLFWVVHVCARKGDICFVTARPSTDVNCSHFKPLVYLL